MNIEDAFCQNHVKEKLSRKPVKTCKGKTVKENLELNKLNKYLFSEYNYINQI